MNLYAQIFREPHVARMLTGAVITRLPVGINALAIVLYVKELTGSYAAAGVVTGMLGLGSGVGAPVRGRMADRLGRRRILFSSAIGHALSLGGLVACGELEGGPVAALALLAFAAGFFTPPSSAVLRSLWPTLLERRPDLLRSAYALDTVMIELVFIGGPLVAGLLAATASPQAGLAVSAAAVLAGTALFTSAAPVRAEQSGEIPDGHGLLGALRSPGLQTLVLSTLPIGICFGAMEVTLPAFAEDMGDRDDAGILLAIWSAGSAAGGLVYGARRWPGSLTRTHMWLALALPLGYLPLVLASSPWAMALLVIPAGALVAPLLATRNELVGRVAPPGAETEAFTWPVTALLGGIAFGAAMAGAVIEASGWRNAVLASVAAAAVGSVLAYARRGTLTSS